MNGSDLLRLCSLILLISSVTAWPWPGSLDNTKNGLVVPRQEDSADNESPPDSSAIATDRESEDASETITKAPDSAESDSADSSADGSAEATTGGPASGEATASGTEDSDASKTSEKAAKTSDVDPRLPPGGIEMVTPAVIGGPQYYKIGDYVTFAWNYTSLSVTPSYIDVLASCSVNSQEYTIAANQTVDPTGAVTWDTNDYQATATVPLLTEKYTLIVMDAALDVSSTPKAGYLGISDQYTFGMYEPRPYTDLDGYQCATCSGALPVYQRQALGFLLTVITINILMFI